MFEFLSCSFGSVLGGLLTSIIAAGGLLFFSMQNTRRGSVEPLPLIFCGLLFCLLFYQTTLMYAAIGSKGIVMDFVSACNLQFGGSINGAELRDQVTTLIRENPLISFFIDYGDLENFDWSQPIKSLRDVIAREYNWFIFRRIIWSLVFIGIVFGGIMLVSGGKKKRRRPASRKSYTYSDYE